MNTKRVMKVIAEELGVEFGEKFNIVGGTNNPYMLSETTLVNCGGDTAHGLLVRLMFGVYAIEKLPWQPKLEEVFYYPTFNYFCKYNSYSWDDSKVDNQIKKAVGVYRTKEEAIAKAKELWGI